MELTPYETPRGSIHHLDHLSSLSDDRCNLLLVSDRTLYLLHNYAALDCSFVARYVKDAYPSGYVPVAAGDPEFDLYQSTVLNFQLEVMEMTCDIQAGLEAIADAIASLSGTGGCGCGGATGYLPCTSGYTNEQLLGPSPESQGDPNSDPPPEGFATWQEYFTYKCQAAHFIWELERKHMVNLRNFDLLALTADIVGPVVAGLLGVLPAALTPPGFAVLVASIVAIGVVAAGSWFFMDQMIDDWDANKENIVCSLYNSGNSVEAVSALSNALEDAIQAIIAWGALEGVAGTIADFLGQGFAQLAGNGIVEPLFKSVVSVTQYEADCSSCDEAQEGILVKTNTISPYDVLQLGDSYDFTCHGDDGFEGSGACPDGNFYFTPSSNFGTFTMKWEVMSPDGGALNWSVYLGTDFQGTFTTHAGTGTWVPYEEQTNFSMTSGLQYRLLATHQPGRQVFFRKVELSAI